MSAFKYVPVFLSLACGFLVVVPVRSLAGTSTINFDSVDTSQYATLGPVDAAPYLATFGITLSGISPTGSTTATGLVGILNDSSNQLHASSGDNYLEQNTSGSPFETFTMNFSAALSSFGFTRIANVTPNLVAEWTATAYSGSTALESVNEDFGLGPFTSATYEMVGTDITSVTFTADGFGVAGVPGAPIDDLVLTTVPDVSSTISLLVAGLAALIGTKDFHRRAG
jgi:hypothetical protein